MDRPKKGEPGYKEWLSEIRCKAARKYIDENPERFSEMRRKATLKSYEENPERRELQSQSITEKWNEPGYRERMSEIQLERYEDPAEREKLSKAQKKRYENPEERRKTSEASMGNPSRTGMKDSEETKKKKSEANKKHYEDPEALRRLEERSKAAWDRNPERRKRMSERMRVQQLGENNPNWQGGVSCEPYDEKWTPEFREDMRCRQNYVCADHNNMCSIDNKALHVHHIDGNKKNSVPENCIALCNSHHVQSHNPKDRKRHRQYVKALMQKEADS